MDLLMRSLVQWAGHASARAAMDRAPRSPVTPSRQNSRPLFLSYDTPRAPWLVSPWAGGPVGGARRLGPVPSTTRAVAWRRCRRAGHGAVVVGYGFAAVYVVGNRVAVDAARRTTSDSGIVPSMVHGGLAGHPGQQPSSSSAHSPHQPPRSRRRQLLLHTSSAGLGCRSLHQWEEAWRRLHPNGFAAQANILLLSPTRRAVALPCQQKQHKPAHAAAAIILRRSQIDDDARPRHLASRSALVSSTRKASPSIRTSPSLPPAGFAGQGTGQQRSPWPRAGEAQVSPAAHGRSPPPRPPHISSSACQRIGYAAVADVALCHQRLSSLALSRRRQGEGHRARLSTTRWSQQHPRALFHRSCRSAPRSVGSWVAKRIVPSRGRHRPRWPSASPLEPGRAPRLGYSAVGNRRGRRRFSPPGTRWPGHASVQGPRPTRPCVDRFAQLRSALSPRGKGPGARSNGEVVEWEISHH